MAGLSAARRDRPQAAASARPPVLREPAGRTDTSTVLPLVLRADRLDGLIEASAPEVAIGPAAAADGACAPVVVVNRPAPDTAPAVTPDRPGCPYATAGGRLTAFILASILLHTAVAAFAVWIALMQPPAAPSGEDAIPVELVVAEAEGAAARQESASGTANTTVVAVASEARQAVEAPQVAEQPRVPAQPVDPVQDEAAVDQPDPLIQAERILDQLPVPPLPETVPILETAPPPPVEAPPVTDRPRVEPLAAATPVPAPAHADPAAVAAAIPVPDLPAQTEVPAELQAALPERPAEPVSEPSPAPPRLAALQPAMAAAPVAAPPATPPASRRAAPTVEQRARATPRPAATVRPERRAPASRQTAAQAREAPRGEGTGQRNSQESHGSAAAGAASAAAMASYRARVLAHLARFKVYPDQARERGITGRAVLAFTLSADGQVTAAALAGSSGAAILDQATLAMVRRAQPFPPMPPGSPATLRFTAGIRYNLH
jgi:TonB family protein